MFSDNRNDIRQFFIQSWQKHTNGQILQPGDSAAGPAVIEYTDSVCVLPGDTSAEVDEHGNLLIEIVLGGAAA